jgi:hypothetical protein
MSGKKQIAAGANWVQANLKEKCVEVSPGDADRQYIAGQARARTKRSQEIVQLSALLEPCQKIQ